MEQDRHRHEREKSNLYWMLFYLFCSWASDISSRTSIVKVSSPNIAGSLPNVVAIGMISQMMNVSKRKQAIVPINDLQVSKIC